MSPSLPERFPCLIQNMLWSSCSVMNVDCAPVCQLGMEVASVPIKTPTLQKPVANSTFAVLSLFLLGLYVVFYRYARLLEEDTYGAVLQRQLVESLNTVFWCVNLEEDVEGLFGYGSCFF